VSSENPLLQKAYKEVLDDHKAHELLHTKYENRRLILQDDFILNAAEGEKKLSLTICFGRGCFSRGAQGLYTSVMQYIHDADLKENTEFKARFCAEKCAKGPVLMVNDEVLENCTYQKAVEAIELALI
jgi:NADH-quinone oxidoreductase subunit G